MDTDDAMRTCALLLCLTSLLVPLEAAHASEPVVSEPVPPEAPPEKTGRGLLGWGSFGVAFGTVAVAGGTFTWIALGDGGGALGAIPITFGAGFIALGIVGIVASKRRLEAYRSWRERSGMGPQVWRRRHQPGRHIWLGRGLMMSGAAILGTGACLAGFGFVGMPPLATYEPGDPDRGLIWMSINGTIGLLAGATMVVMGAVEHRRYRRWTPAHASFRVVPHPWATTTAGGFGIAGQF